MSTDTPADAVPGAPEDPTRTVHLSEALSGSAIGPYQLGLLLGEGGMGMVYHALQLRPIRRDVALKVIKPGMDSKEVIARFESERQALAMMEHANIAQVFDAGTTDRGLPYFVMELVDGVPITRYCDSKRLTVKERIKLFILVCRAIQHAHQKGIIHRDIKPSNILVKQQEGRAAPKVIDFGLAKALGGNVSDATMVANVNAVVGTLDYMSPEQAELGRQNIDTRSDVYSLGAVLYELLTGKTPLEQERQAKASYVEALQRIREEDPNPPSTRLRRSEGLSETAALRRCDPAKLPRLLHHELDWIVMKALEKDRTRRYETANALARDLERYLDGEPVEAAPPSTAYRMRKFVRKHRLWLATAAAFVAVLVAGVVISAWMAVRAGRAEQEARAINDFLQNDLLAQASASIQARPDTKPDPDLRVRTALDRAAGRIAGKFSAQPQIEASIRQTIGSTYLDLGVYAEAQRQIERALELRRQVLGDDHPNTLHSMNSFATVLERQGKFAQAEPLYTRVLALRNRELGEEHPETLLSMYGLAATHAGQGKYELAETTYAKLLDIQRRVLGEEHQRTLNTMANLAASYHFRRQYRQAEPLYVRTLEVKLRVLGEEHPSTLSSMVNLAELYRDQGRYKEAKLLYDKGLAIQRRVLGEDHRWTIYTMNSLAGLYAAERNYAQAAALYTKARDAGLRSLGEEHPHTLDSMNGLADTCRREGKDEYAAEVFAKALALRIRVLGEGHPDSAKTLASLGEVQLGLKKFTDAEANLHRALRAIEATKADRWERFNYRSLLGASLARQKRFVEAEPLLLSGYDGMLERIATIPAADRSVLEEAGQRIVQLYRDWGRPEKTSEWQQKVRQLRR